MGPAARNAAPKQLLEEALVFDPAPLLLKEVFRRRRRCVERSNSIVVDGADARF
jgi:hypothetical protein